MTSDIKLCENYLNKFNSAKSRHIPFDLSFMSYKNLLSSKKCFYTGEVFSTNSNSPHYKTLDRVDNSKGYTKGNVVACQKYININKGNLSVQEIEKIAEKIDKLNFNYINDIEQVNYVDDEELVKMFVTLKDISKKTNLPFSINLNFLRKVMGAETCLISGQQIHYKISSIALIEYEKGFVDNNIYLCPKRYYNFIFKLKKETIKQINKKIQKRITL